MNSSFSLSQRLSRFVTLAQEGQEFWDIGCDHGLVGRAILANRSFRHVHFVDPAESVILKLKESLDADIPEQVLFSIHQKKACEIKPQGEGHTFLMAGFGGKMQIEGLENLKQIANSRFILSPHRDHLLLRQYLQSDNWGLVEEEILSEDGQFYSILVVENRPGKPVSLYGEEQWGSEAGRAYRRHLLDILPLHQGFQDLAYLNYLLKLANSGNYP